MPVLVSFPADPTRSYALAIEWPAVGYWSFAASRWVEHLDPPACLIPAASASTDPGHPELATCRAYLPETGASADVLVLLVAVDPSGRPVELAAVDVLSPDPTRAPRPIPPPDPARPAG